MKTSALARAVAKRMENEKTWARGALAFDVDGYVVPATSPKACKWCAQGHADFVRHNGGNHLSRAYLVFFGSHLDGDNDNKGREYVMQRLVELAEHLESQGK